MMGIPIFAPPKVAAIRNECRFCCCRRQFDFQVEIRKSSAAEMIGSLVWSHRHTTQDSQWMIFTCHFWQPTNLKVTVINLALSSKCHLVIHETAEQVMILCSRFFFHSCVPIEFVLMTLRKRTNRIPPLPPWWWHNSPFCFFLFSICHWLPLESWHSFI